MCGPLAGARLALHAGTHPGGLPGRHAGSSRGKLYLPASGGRAGNATMCRGFRLRRAEGGGFDPGPDGAAAGSARAWPGISAVAVTAEVAAPAIAVSGDAPVTSLHPPCPDSARHRTARRGCRQTMSSIGSYMNALRWIMSGVINTTLSSTSMARASTRPDSLYRLTRQYVVV